MLALDVMEGDAPQVWATLTTRTATLDLAPYYEARRLVQRALRREWPGARYVAHLEYTSGYGPRSGGRRRPHWHMLWKGIPAADAERAAAVAIAAWCRNCDADPAGQYFAAVDDAGAVLKYVTKHFRKGNQCPPEGFKGRRFSSSRDYFTGCTVRTARARAAESLALKRELWKRRHLDAYDAELGAREAMQRRASTWWVLCNARGVRVGAYCDDPARRVLSDRALLCAHGNATQHGLRRGAGDHRGAPSTRPEVRAACVAQRR